jgi:hypothetical protein
MRRLIAMMCILFGVLLIPLSVHVPGSWMYERLAVRAAFGERADAQQVTVVSITKPSTVTFSNGQRIDVGGSPALISTAFQIIVCLPLVGCYVFVVRRYGPEWTRGGSVRTDSAS